jgi:MurNAc alpha-1-phosphate uridylyltransferase
MILAAGRGERMGALSEQVPKPLLRAGGTSLIERQVRALVAAGMQELVINVSHHAQAIVSALGTGSALGARIRYSHEPAALETAGGIALALPLLGGAPFAVVNADLYCEYDYARLHRAQALLQRPDEQALAFVVLVDNPAHHPAGDFVLAAGGRVASGEGERLTFSGIGVYHPRLFADIVPGERARLGVLLHRAAAAGAVRGERFAGRWFDIGTPQRLADLRALLGDRESQRPA